MTIAIRPTAALLAGAATALIAQPSWAQATSSSELAVQEAQSQAEASAQGEETAIIVTGTRIRGAEIAGDIITLESEAIIAAGQIDLGEALRSLPQNFGGGQNPGVSAPAGRTAI
jgi:iron complex outermembrane recepter protein